jgi:hypothetical protein
VPICFGPCGGDAQLTFFWRIRFTPNPRSRDGVNRQGVRAARRDPALRRAIRKRRKRLCELADYDADTVCLILNGDEACKCGAKTRKAPIEIVPMGIGAYDAANGLFAVRVTLRCTVSGWCMDPQFGPQSPGGDPTGPGPTTPGGDGPTGPRTPGGRGPGTPAEPEPVEPRPLLLHGQRLAVPHASFAPLLLRRHGTYTATPTPDMILAYEDARPTIDAAPDSAWDPADPDD